MAFESTIAAIATGPSAGGIGIVRVSGRHALEAVRGIAPGMAAAPVPQRATLTRFFDRSGQLLDEGLFLFFRAPHSYTGEDTVECHVHGSPRLLSFLLGELLKDDRVRLAEPGEFTRRAFLSGRMDLTQAEAVADLVAAQSEGAVRAAAAQVKGELGARLHAFVEPLRELCADIEGVLAFPDEAEGEEAAAAQRLARLVSQAQALWEQGQRGRLVRRGARVVIFGPVNAGKSTLFNRLLNESRALVDDAPGTTRDVLEAQVEWQGLGVTLIDCAGLRDNAERLEALGIERTRAALKSADLAVLLLPPGATDEEAERWTKEAGDVTLLRVASKSDMRAVERTSRRESHRPVSDLAADVSVSGHTGEGVDALTALIHSRLGAGRSMSIALISERHADALRRALSHLTFAQSALTQSTLEVVAGELGLALEALAEITGERADKALLDEIFRRFCVGK